ncbi:MAG UNVERIFIED_CONTAM: hypothetical protein LVR29_34680 [Microcystis novacekii LVE1205-3]
MTTDTPQSDLLSRPSSAASATFSSPWPPAPVRPGPASVSCTACYALTASTRILFLVDRTALGTQADDAFKDVRLEGVTTFADMFEVKSVDDITPAKGTRVHIATGCTVW